MVSFLDNEGLKYYDERLKVWVEAKVEESSSASDKKIEELDNKVKTEVANSLDMSLDETTYVLSYKLSSEDGSVLSEGELDLPIEELVKDGRYDDTTKEIVLILENGQEIRIPAGDLVENKLDKSDQLLSVYNTDENGNQRMLYQRSDEAKGWTFPLRFKDGQVVVARSDVKTDEADLTYIDYLDGGKTKVLDYKTCAINQYQLDEAINPYKKAITPVNRDEYQSGLVSIGNNNDFMPSSTTGYSLLVGYNNTLDSGRCSLVGGYGSNGKFNDSIMWGTGLVDTTGSYGKAIFGTYNSPSNAKVVIGGGSSTDNRKNAVEIYSDGQVYTPNAAAYQTAEESRLTTKKYVDDALKNPVSESGVFIESVTVGQPPSSGAPDCLNITSDYISTTMVESDSTWGLGGRNSVYNKATLWTARDGSATFADIIRAANNFDTKLAKSSEQWKLYGTDLQGDTCMRSVGTVKYQAIPEYDPNGALEANALLLKSPSGTTYKITVSDDGTLSTTKAN